MTEKTFARDLAKVLALLAKQGKPVTAADLKRPARRPRPAAGKP